jgi:hypothetical protein
VSTGRSRSLREKNEDESVLREADSQQTVGTASGFAQSRQAIRPFPFESDRMLEPFLEINDPAEGVHKISEPAGRQHNCIASPTHILGDLKKTPTLIFFQVEKKNFSIHLNLFRGERIIGSVGCITVNHSLL